MTSIKELEDKFKFAVIDNKSGQAIARGFQEFCKCALMTDEGNMMYVKDAEKDFSFSIEGEKMDGNGSFVKWIPVSKEYPKQSDSPIYLADTGDDIVKCGFAEKDAGIWPKVKQWCICPVPSTTNK